MYVTPYTSPSDPSYTLAATFFAFLPLLLHLFSILPKVVSQTQQEESSPAEEQEQEQKQTSHILGPILTYLVSDLELSILELLDGIGGEMSTRDMLRHFTDMPQWSHVDRSDLNRCLYRMHEQSIICMRKEGYKPLWSMPA